MSFNIEPPSKDGLFGIVVGGLITAIGGIIGVILKNRNAHAQRLADRDISLRETGVAASQDLTARMEALMNAYEVHIKELSSDLVSCKAELRQLKIENDMLKSGKTTMWGETDAG